MGLKELLDKVDFDTLAPFIEKTEGRHLDSIYAYREEYGDMRTGTIVSRGDEREVKVVFYC